MLFRYTAVGFHGTGHISYQQALAAVFLEGWFFLLIAATGMRTRIAKLIPLPVRISTAAGEDIDAYRPFVFDTQ